MKLIRKPQVGRPYPALTTSPLLSRVPRVGSLTCHCGQNFLSWFVSASQEVRYFWCRTCDVVKGTP